MKDEDYKLAYYQASEGLPFSVGLKILIASPQRELTEACKDIISRHAYKMFEELDIELSRDESARVDNYKELVSCFKEPIYAKEIPNEYSNSYVNRPWLLVTTQHGVFKIGWRKRVIVVDWSESNFLVKADDIFKEEDVTKSERMIHAWGLEKAKEYIQRLFDWYAPPRG